MNWNNARLRHARTTTLSLSVIPSPSTLFPVPCSVLLCTAMHQPAMFQFQLRTDIDARPENPLAPDAESQCGRRKCEPPPHAFRADSVTQQKRKAANPPASLDRIRPHVSSIDWVLVLYRIQYSILPFPAQRRTTQGGRSCTYDWPPGLLTRRHVGLSLYPRPILALHSTIIEGIRTDIRLSSFLTSRGAPLPRPDSAARMAHVARREALPLSPSLSLWSLLPRLLLLLLSPSSGPSLSLNLNPGSQSTLQYLRASTLD